MASSGIFFLVFLLLFAFVSFGGIFISFFTSDIRVNTVNRTVMTKMGRLGWTDPVKAKEMLNKIPLGRFSGIHEVVNAIVFLLSDKASMIHGVTLPVDGGFLI